jgi:Tfp pilus assembly protein PilF
MFRTYFTIVKSKAPCHGLVLFVVAGLLAFQPGTAAAQAGGHTLFGDVKIDESKVDTVVPLSFEIILYTESGTLLGRQTVGNNSRYRFLNVANGRYDVGVEVEGLEVARIRVWVQSAYKTDHRQDILLEWHEDTSRRRPRAQTVSAADFYVRTAQNKSRFERAQRLLDKRQYEEAASTLKQIVDTDPADFQAWTEFGTANLMRGHPAEAEKAYRHAIQQRPNFVLALLNLGRILVAQERYADAIEPLTRTTQARGESAEAHFLLGECYLKLKMGSKAVPHLSEALRIDPQGKAEAHLKLAGLYDAAGFKERAAAEYRMFLAKRPDYRERKKLEQYISQNNKP